MKQFQSGLFSLLKSIFLTLVITAAAAALLSAVFMAVIFGLPKSYDTAFADKAVVSVEYQDISFTKEISQEHVTELKQILGKGNAWHETPACAWGAVCLVLSGAEKELRLYPMTDDCEQIAIVDEGKAYYFSTKGEGGYARLREILEQYGVEWPYI